MNKPIALFLTLFLLAVNVIAAPVADAQTNAQTNDCTELQRVIQETELPLVDADAESRRAARHNAAQDGLATLQCARADGGGQPVAIELNPQYATQNYQSRCPPIAPPPAPPTTRVSQAEFNAAVTSFNAWAETNRAQATCRRAEIEEIRQQVVVAMAALAVWNQRADQQAATVSAELGARLSSRRAR